MKPPTPPNIRTPWQSIEDLYHSWAKGQWGMLTLEQQTEVATIWRRLMRLRRAVVPSHLQSLADRVKSHQSRDPSSARLLNLVSELLPFLEPRILSDRASIVWCRDFRGNSEPVYPTLRSEGRRAPRKTPEGRKAPTNLVRTPEAVQQIHTLRAQGLSAAKIAKVLQLQGMRISKSTVFAAIRAAS